MSVQNYVVIDTIQLKCVNIIVWDGDSSHSLIENLISQLSDGSINIGDTVELLNGIYKQSIPVSSPSPVDSFSVDQFVQDLLGAFSGDYNILPYYSVVKDLANFKNFTGMKAMIAELLSASKITQDEVNTFNSVLMNQNINLNDF